MEKQALELEPERRNVAVDPGSICIEQRMITRADGSQTSTEVITGRAVVFDQQSQLLGWFREIIRRKAFDNADMSDVVCVKNHDDDQLLGRTPDSLSLEVREDGLYFVAYPPATQCAKDCIEEIRAKMLKGCSFRFQVTPGTSDWETDPATGTEIRTVNSIYKLYDVGPVTFPAYLQTSTDVAQRYLQAWKQQHQQLANERGLCVKIEIKEEEDDKENVPDMPGMTEEDGYKLKRTNTTNTDTNASRSVEAELDLLAMEIELY